MGTRSRKKLMKEETADFSSSVKGSSEQQAIRNAEILEKIFEHCPIETLKHCRLVSKEWYDVSLTQFRSRAVLKLKTVRNKLPLSVQKFFGNPHKNWKQPFAHMMKFETSPYRRLRIDGRFLGEIHAEYLVTFLAPYLYELYFDFSFSNDYWKKLIFELTPNLKILSIGDRSPGFKHLEFEAANQQQNLKRLEMNNGKFYDLPVTWDALLSTFTKLEEIVFTVGYYDEKFCTIFAEFLNAVKNVKSQNPDNLPVHYLDVMGKCFLNGAGDKLIPESILTLLHDVKFPLKTLKIDFREDIQEAVVQQLLNLYSDTLESLVILRGEPAQNLGWRPRSSFVNPFNVLMKSLRSLKIFGPILKDMSSLQYTPNLETLSICEVSFSEYSPGQDEKGLDKFPSAKQMVDEVIDVVKLSKLREFNAYFTLEHASTVKILGSWMPNLENLRARVTSGDGFGQVCLQWRDTLYKLVIGSRSFLVDEDITVFAFGVGKEKRNRAPNVTLLKNLQIFRMEKFTCSKEKPRILKDDESDDERVAEENKCIRKFSKITDHSVHHGFLKLAQLHTLELESTENIEEKTLDLLKTMSIHVTVRIRQTCECPRPRYMTTEERQKKIQLLQRRKN